MSLISKLWKKLRTPEYRRAFVDSEINIGIPFQIRALAKVRGWTQSQLAEKADMAQPRICDLMKPGATSPNIKTLARLAAAFDCGLAVRFVPFSDMARWAEEFDPEGFDVRPFDEDAEPFDRSAILDERAYSLEGLQLSSLITGYAPSRWAPSLNQGMTDVFTLPLVKTQSPEGLVTWVVTSELPSNKKDIDSFTTSGLVERGARIAAGSAEGGANYVGTN